MKSSHLLSYSAALGMFLTACGSQESSSRLHHGTPVSTCEFHHVYTNNPDEVDAYRLSNLPSIRPLASTNPRIWSGEARRFASFGLPMLFDAAGLVGNQVILYGPYRQIEAGGTWWVEVKYNAVNANIHWQLAMHEGSNTFLKADSGPGEGTWISPIYPAGAGIPDLEVKALPTPFGYGAASVEIKEMKIIQRSPDFLAAGNPDCPR